MHSPQVVNKIISLRRNFTRSITLDQFISKHTLKTYKKGEMILLKNEIPSAVYVIESGTVKAYIIDQNGCEQLVSMHSKGESLPIGFVFWLTKRSQYFYVAYSDCCIRLVPRDDMTQFIESSSRNLYSLCIKLTKKMILLMRRVSVLEQSSASRKVALGLLHTPDQLGVNQRPHKTRLKISITQQEIANSLGLTRETTSIELKKLQKMRLISYSRNKYTLYMDRLRKYINRED